MNTDHPLLKYHLEQASLQADIRYLHQKIGNLERDTIEALAIYKVGQLVKVKGIKLYVKARRLDKYSTSGLSYHLVKPNSMSKTGKSAHIWLDEEHIDI